MRERNLSEREDEFSSEWLFFFPLLLLLDSEAALVGDEGKRERADSLPFSLRFVSLETQLQL